MGTGVEAVRRVTWRFVHARTCYVLCLTVMSRFSRTRITLNGFIIHKQQHHIWSQVLLRAVGLGGVDGMQQHF